MNIIKTIIFLALITSCGEIESDQNILEFDKTLGEQNVATLDYLVSDFENDFLKRQFPNLKTENAYKEFLTGLRDKKTDEWKKISTKSRLKFEKSALKDEIYRYPDSVWIERDTAKMRIKSPEPIVISRFKYKNEDGSVEYLESQSSVPPMKNLDVNWLLEQKKDTPEFNTVGKYIQALYQIKDRDSFFNNFYKIKRDFGFIANDNLARVMLNDSVDFNDCLIKRIIVLETAY